MSLQLSNVFESEIEIRLHHFREDFVERWRRRTEAPALVWLRIGNATNAALLGWFLPMLPAIITRLQSGDRLIEVR